MLAAFAPCENCRQGKGVISEQRSLSLLRFRFAKFWGYKTLRILIFLFVYFIAFRFGDIRARVANRDVVVEPHESRQF